MRRWLAAAAGVLAWGLAIPGEPVRMVMLGGNAGEPAVAAHVANARALGFGAVWGYSHQVGSWTGAGPRKRPRVTRGFVALARECHASGMEVWVSVNPVADTGERFAFSDDRGERALLDFAALLRKKAGVRHLVLSFDDQPTDLTLLADIFRYGRVAAAAHLDLARRLRAALPADTELWLCASAYCDGHLGDGSTPYAKAFLAGLPALPESIGIVWTGPRVISPSITRADLAATRARLGGRRLFLYDNFPADGGGADGLALVLGALRHREPGILEEIAVYLAAPMDFLGASRLPLATTADFLREPRAYDPDAAAARAVARLAGPSVEAAKALEVQQMEWGGFVDGRNYWSRDAMNARAAAGRLNDPAFVDSFTWTAARYPARMHALAGLADAAFRSDLLTVMARRLAVARAMPLAIEYLARVRAGRPDAADVLAQIDRERASWSGAPDTARVLETFLATAGVPAPVSR